VHSVSADVTACDVATATAAAHRFRQHVKVYGVEPQQIRAHEAADRSLPKNHHKGAVTISSDAPQGSVDSTISKVRRTTVMAAAGSRGRVLAAALLVVLHAVIALSDDDVLRCFAPSQQRSEGAAHGEVRERVLRLATADGRDSDDVVLSSDAEALLNNLTGPVALLVLAGAAHPGKTALLRALTSREQHPQHASTATLATIQWGGATEDGTSLLFVGG
jgi:hypothetical protein